VTVDCAGGNREAVGPRGTDTATGNPAETEERRELNALISGA